MAVVALDDTDPVDAIVLAYREEMNAVRARGGFYGSTQSKAVWQDSKPTEDFLTTERRRKVVAKSGKAP